MKVFDGTNVNYIVLGEGSSYVVFLHGWGGSIESFKYVAENLKLGKKCLIVDFPPFGKSTEPKTVWGVEEYARALKEVLDKEKIQKFDIISHSFGGRVAIYFSSVYTDMVGKLVLIDSAGLKPKKKFIKRLKVAFYKLAKSFGFYFNFGSTDYNALSPHMKKCFVKIVNRSLKPEAKTLKLPTLIIYGENDKDTPVYMGKRLSKLIKGSKFIVLKNAGHFSYLDNFYEFKPLVENFIGG